MGDRTNVTLQLLGECTPRAYEAVRRAIEINEGPDESEEHVPGVFHWSEAHPVIHSDTAAEISAWNLGFALIWGGDDAGVEVNLINVDQKTWHADSVGSILLTIKECKTPGVIGEAQSDTDIIARGLSITDEQFEHEYAFDVTLNGAIRVKASSETVARSMLVKHLDAADTNFGAWPNGDPILGEVSLHSIDTLFEIDGVDAEAD